MPKINKSNRAVCDVDIRLLHNKMPFIFLDTANTTTAGLSSEDTYAMAKGSKRISFSNPLDGTMSVEAQVFPFELYSIFGDGTIKTDALIAQRKVITATEAGSITLPESTQTGTVFVFALGDWGGAAIKGSVAANKFTATTSSEIVQDTQYEVAYIVNKTTGVKRVSLNNVELPQDFYITMKTVEKSEDGLLTPYLITAYKAKPKRALDLSFSSTGDPISLKIEFSLLEDKDGNVMDMTEIIEED